MKNHGESVQSTNTPEKVSPWRRLVAIGALSTVALTGCAAETQAKPEPTKTEQVTETETPATPEKVTHDFKTEVPKYRENWNVNREGLISLSEMFEAKGDAAYGDPEFMALQAQVREEFLANNPVPGDVDRPKAPEERREDNITAILAWYDATAQLYREYISDVFREQHIRNINESEGRTDSQSTEDWAVRTGIEIALFNGLPDSLSLRDPNMLYLMRTDGTGDAPLPTITRGIDTGNGGMLGGGSGLVPMPHATRAVGIFNTVTVEGKEPLQVFNRFDYDATTDYWNLTAETSPDPNGEGAKLAEY